MIRKRVAITTAKLANYICRKMGRQGVTWAGKIALRLYPNILRDLAKEMDGRIFVVCGTNGKTTTNNMLASFLREEGHSVVCNSTGSNMLNGVVSAFVLASKHGHMKADYACIEVDEASTLRVFPHFTPNIMVITNLFRDQLDRYGEIDITMDYLKQAVAMDQNIKLLVNGDDVLSTSLAIQTGHPYACFGISEQVFETNNTNEIREGQFCQMCGAPLVYDFYHYSQLGMYHCSNEDCHFSRPEMKYDGSSIELTNGLTFTLNGTNYHSNYRGFYNIYNILAAFGAANEMGINLPHMQQVLDQFKPENGRMETFEIKGKHILLNLAKNPAGFNQNINAVMEDSSKKDLLIVINDNSQDGHDISWIWDVDFDRFSDANLNELYVSGLRCYDMELRFKYCDMKCTPIFNVEEAINTMLQKESSTDNIYILVNYTALFSTRKYLKSLEEASR